MKLILAALLCALLVGCGGGLDEDDTRDKQPPICREKPSACL